MLGGILDSLRLQLNGKDNMLCFKDRGGNKKFRARTYQGVVRKMRIDAWQSPGKPAYMRGVATRIGVLDRGISKISTASPEAFVLSLVRFGWLIPVKETK